MRMRALLVALTLSLAVGAGSARAGAKWSSPVYIDSSTRYASGSIGTARNSTDTTQYIYCGMYAQPWYGPNGYCYARTASGVSAGCNFSSNSYLEKVVMSMTADAYLVFWWNADGTCNEISVASGSTYEPKR